jgi:hypothetical protein
MEDMKNTNTLTADSDQSVCASRVKLTVFVCCVATNLVLNDDTNDSFP